MSGETTRSGVLPDLWDDAHAAKLDEPGRLLYRSNLLGSDLRITNFGGGNTSAKVTEADPLTGAPTLVLWVKGSGGDIGSMKRDGFSTLYLDKLIGLKKRFRGIEHEDEMVALFDHCTFNLNPRACSIDTPLHGFVPHAHVDHVHADAVIAIAASENAEALTKEVFGDAMGFLPWQRPGFDLGLKLGAMAEANPKLIGVVLGGHGLFTWGPTAKECYQTTIATINKASAWLEAKMRKPAFGGAKHQSLSSAAARRDAAAKLLPQIRARISAGERKIGHFSDAPEVLEFVNSKAMPSLAPLGTSCPDHFLRTKIRPLVLAFDPAKPDVDATIASLDVALEAYRKDYAAYYARCKHPNSPDMRDANAVVYLAPGLGMFTFAKDKATARIAGEFYINAINVMRGASGVSTYVGLAEQEAFNIEYWLLEEAKLKRMPKPKSLAGRVSLVTAAGGIGRAIASQQLGQGACVVLADIDGPALEQAVVDFSKQFGKDVVYGVRMNVTDEAAVDAAFAEAVLAYGGLDILISNAGIASAAPFEDTTLETWNRNITLMATGYFLAARAGFRLMKAQKSNIVIASKNGLAASPGASAYCTAKAAEIHLARCLALEGAPHGIRVNTVNPDAVLRGSKIWQGEWRTQRAASNKVSEAELEEVYRQRSMLKLAVYPEEIAEAVTFFVSDASAKSTGNILNVDAGNLVSFPR